MVGSRMRIAGIGMITWFGWVLGCSSGAPTFQGADRIDLWILDLDTGERIVTRMEDSDRIEALVSRISLGSAHHCGCDHLEGLTIHRGGEKTDVTICDHCFQIEGGEDYDMPEGFYEEYRRLAPTREGR